MEKSVVENTTAAVIEDSVSPGGKRITTMVLRYPRYLHSEIMTHRAFSRNASSSRAQPVKKLLGNAVRYMAHPEHWGTNNPGMQSREEAQGWRLLALKALWRTSGLCAVGFAWAMSAVGGHKQLVNRILEPWTHIIVVVTSTEWDNFFELRDHPDAQPEVQVLAKKMRRALERSSPKHLRPGEWHLPYVLIGERGRHDVRDLIRFSVARCARTSYSLHDGSLASPEKDLSLYERLVGSVPLHASPSEHQATPDEQTQIDNDLPWQHPDEWGNLREWRQFRKILEKEVRNG